MMEREFDTVIRISPQNGEVVVEQTAPDGIVSRKLLKPESLAKCFLGGFKELDTHYTGLLPQSCIAATLTPDSNIYYIRYPSLRADISYYGTEYENFPLPRLVFAFRYLPVEGKLTSSSVYVVGDERPTPDTPVYRYPFSNVSSDGRICIGNNALPVYESPTKLGSLAGFILRMPNNNDHYSANDNKLGMGYRDLLEHLKDKEPEYYYSDVLIPDGKTLEDLITGR